MKRECDLNQITDGKRYQANDMVRADCLGCKGCSACCKGMDDSVVLDPYDIARMSEQLGKSFQQLLSEERIAFANYEGMILPHLNTVGSDYHCSFLGQETDGDMAGRCLIHSARPGICRLFPLGRLYEEGTFSYVLQTKECKQTQRGKVKVEKWVDQKPLKPYENYIRTWHNYVLKVQHVAQCMLMGELTEAEQRERKQLLHQYNTWMIQKFYVQTVPIKEFYNRFYEVEAEADSLLNALMEEE